MLDIRVASIVKAQKVFLEITPLLQQAVELAPNDINIQTLKYSLLKGTSLLLPITDLDQSKIIAINILQPITLVTGYKILYIPITIGERMEEWLTEAMVLVHQTAKKLGCKELRGMSQRKAWVRMLNKHGSNWHSIHEIIGCKVKL